MLYCTFVLAAFLLQPAPAFAQTSTYCPTLNATVAFGGSVAIDVSTCDGPLDAGMSGPIAPFAQHGTVTIGANSGGSQFVTYAHSGDAATSDQFFLEDNDLGVVQVDITIDPSPPTLSIGDASMSEGDSGSTFFSFQVTLDRPAPTGGVTFDVETSDGTAVAGEDYQALSLTAVTIGAGSAGVPITIQVFADTDHENDEVFFVNITNVTGATLADSQGVGVIFNDDLPPTITLSPASLPAANVGAAYSQTITAAGGTGPYVYALVSGFLPAGVSMNSTGVLSGTPTVAGTFNFTVTATDSSAGAGPYTGSVAYTLQVGSAVPPTVSSVGAPAARSYTIGDNLYFAVQFDTDVNVTGSPRIPLTVGSTTRYATFMSGASVQIFRYVVGAGDQDLDGIRVGAAIDLDGGTIESPDGTPADLTLNNVGDTSNVLVYGTVPTVVDSRVAGSPPSNSTSVTFEIVFSEAVTGLTLSDLSLATTGSATATLADLQTSDNTSYTVAANGITGTGTLRLDVVANAVVNIAGIGNPAYSSGTAWVVAPSTDATLAGLVPSAGSLDPAFDPATADYDVAVDNATDSITLTPTATESTATITVDGQSVASGSASQAIALAVGSTAIQVVVTAADGTTTRAYTATVTRAASSNARLANLVPSVGTLDPAFDAGSFDYAIGVANAVDSIALTPTADNAEATITVNGQSVASGSASQAIALSVGSTAIQVGVTAEDGTTTRTYTVTVERAHPVPTVISRAIEVDAGDTASVDLAEGATGGPFTGAAIVDLSNAEAGTARIERDGQTYQLIFVASATYAGEADLRFTLSNAAGTSAPGTIAFTIVGRPDPAQDPEVVGLLTAQVDAAKRFAQVQTRNFNDRLEQLHDEGDRRTNSMNLRLGYNAEEGRGDREIQQLVERAHETSGLLGYAPHDAGGSTSGAFASDEKATSPASGSGEGLDLGPFAVWTGGYVNFGESDDGGLALDHTMVGVSAGIDYRFSKKFIGGFGVGFGRDRTDVGANGTQSTGRAYSAAVYGSYKPLDNFFLDGLIGGSWLDFDSRRFVTATGDFANGTRSGHQLFGSLTAAYEFRDQAWLVSPYGRVEMSRTWLDGFTEEGGGDFGLRYGDQSIDTVSGVIGLRAKYAFKTGWGTLTPGARVEYTHDFAGSSRISLGYIDMDRLPYWLDIEASNRSYVTLGLSLDAELPQAWTLGFDYRTAFGNDAQEHAIGLELAKRF